LVILEHARMERGQIGSVMKKPLARDIVKNYPSKPQKKLNLQNLSPEFASHKILTFLRRSYSQGRKTVEILTAEKSSFRQQMEIEEDLRNRNLQRQGIFDVPINDTKLGAEANKAKKERRMDLAAKKQLDDILEKTLETLKRQTGWIQYYRWNKISKNKSSGMLIYLTEESFINAADQEFPKAA